MRGSGATRFCDSCRKHVTNLSELTKAQASDFLAAHAGQSVCVRYRVRRDGEIEHKPAPSLRLGFVAALSLAMAACTGYVDADELDTPEDALVCHDAFGYAVPCEEVDEGVIPYADAVPPADDEPETIAATDEPVPPPEPEEAEFLGQAVSEPATGEGCPIPTPDEGEVDMGGELMGDVEPMLMGVIDAPSNRRAARREARRERRLERRLARRDRRE
jgi:hypothetical protein